MSEELKSSQFRSLAEAPVVSSKLGTTEAQDGDQAGTLWAKLLALLQLTHRSGVLLDEGGVARPVKRKWAMCAEATDNELVPPVPGKIIRVISLVALDGDTATALTLKSSNGAELTDISPMLQNGINGGEVLPRNQDGWTQTLQGQGLVVTLGLGTSTGVMVNYIEVPNYIIGDDGLVATDERGQPITAPDAP